MTVILVTSITTACICHSQDTAFETLLALNYNSFILTVAIIGAGINSIEAGEFNVFDSHARDMYHNSHSEGTCVLLEIPSMHKLVQYFQTLHRNEDIQLFRERLSEKVHATIPKGIVGGFVCPVLQRNLKGSK